MDKKLMHFTDHVDRQHFRLKLSCQLELLGQGQDKRGVEQASGIVA